MSSLIRVYIDGACSGNPGPGGWGAILIFPEQHVIELGGGESQTTNNQMELTAALQALIHLEKTSGSVQLFVDSKYVIDGITKWSINWEKNGWKTKENKPVLNQELWKKLRAVVKNRRDSLIWTYVKAHNGNPGNERVDEIAVSFSKGISARLFEGTSGEYSKKYRIRTGDS